MILNLYQIGVGFSTTPTQGLHCHNPPPWEFSVNTVPLREDYSHTYVRETSPSQEHEYPDLINDTPPTNNISLRRRTRTTENAHGQRGKQRNGTKLREFSSTAYTDGSELEGSGVLTLNLFCKEIFTDSESVREYRCVLFDSVTP